jgi:hypothetical protein
MSPLETLGFALGTSFASGLNVYATVAAAGLFQRFGLIQLPDNLQVLASPIVLGIAIALFLIEFIADKIPYVDTAWDAVHTFIRPPAAALISYTAFGQVPEEWKVSAALLAGGVALTSHGAKATTRAAANTSGVSGLDGGGSPVPHSGTRGGARYSGGAPDLEALRVYPGDAGSAPALEDEAGRPSQPRHLAESGPDSSSDSNPKPARG